MLAMPLAMIKLCVWASRKPPRAKRLRIPQGGIAQLLGALRQLYQLRRV
jgi:hypothetical protein